VAAGSCQSDPFVDAVGRFIDEQKLLPPEAVVVVGVSGGADSVGLLAVLRDLSRHPGRGYRLTAAHLDHGLRAESHTDAAFVEELSRAWDIPCLIERRDVAGEAKRAGEGIEQAARQVRYAFLRDAAAEAGARYVAVGHHADDNVETILYRIVRGTHLRGLIGMPANRSLEGSAAMLVRPFLCFGRAEIESFCRRANLSWRIDSTNVDTGYRRNFIRHELLPMLRSRLNPRADEALLRLAAAAGDVEAFVSGLAEALLDRAICESGGGRIVIDRGVLAAEPLVVQACALRLALERMSVPLRAIGAGQFAALRGLLGSDGPNAVTLSGGYVARREHGEVVIELPGPGPQADAAVVTLECPGRTALGDGWAVVCRIEPFQQKAFEEHCRNRSAGVEMLDADRICGALECRARRRGDAFVPLGAPGTQTVGDFLRNLKLPQRRREEVRCICDDLGIVYLVPLRIDDRLKVTSATRRVLRVRLERDATHEGPPSRT